MIKRMEPAHRFQASRLLRRDGTKDLIRAWDQHFEDGVLGTAAFRSPISVVGWKALAL